MSKINEMHYRQKLLFIITVITPLLLLLLRCIYTAITVVGIMLWNYCFKCKFLGCNPLTSSIPDAVKKMPTSFAYFCSSLYCSWLNSRWRLCSPYVFPQECLEVYGRSSAFLLNLYSSSLFWNFAQSAPQS